MTFAAPRALSREVIKATIDRPKLEKSLKRFANQFGDTNAQALVRWGIQTARELAFETQAWGRKDTRNKQIGAIIADAYNVLKIVPKEPRGRTAVKDASEANEWIEMNRTRRRGRTAKLPISEKKRCTREVFDAAIKMRSRMAGAAKGGWLGAGQEIARAQTGMDKINIGKNFLGYAQKHAHFGSSMKPRRGFFPKASITNGIRHSGSAHVLASGAGDKAINFGLKKTVTWYRSALRKIDQQKP